ncbi:MAG: type II toxin-antitoxin system VapC family toxin [Myxococcaceae bacterium]|nr:type II toxin-antitoxin system VapC family toxin [Myxococcaceae bacterium]
MAAEAVFVDTSVLVAASVEEHPGHEASRSFLNSLQEANRRLCISPQVCRELVSVLSGRPIAGRLFSVREALDILDGWRGACALLTEDGPVVEEWLRLVGEHNVRGKKVHDTNLVAVMLTHGIRRLATRNASDFARYGDIIQVDAVAP